MPFKPFKRLAFTSYSLSKCPNLLVLIPLCNSAFITSSLKFCKCPLIFGVPTLWNELQKDLYQFTHSPLLPANLHTALLSLSLCTIPFTTTTDFNNNTMLFFRWTTSQLQTWSWNQPLLLTLFGFWCSASELTGLPDTAFVWHFTGQSLLMFLFKHIS